MKSIVTTLIVGMALLMVGCVDFGPKHGTEEFFDTVRESGIDDDIQFARKGYRGGWDRWAPAAEQQQGVIALTETSVVFLQFNGDLERFQVSFRRDLSEIDGIHVSGWGQMRKLQAYGDGFYDIYGLYETNLEGEEELLAFFERHGIERTAAKEG